MTTVRVAIAGAMRALRAAAPGDDPVADELAAGLEAAQELVLALHEGRGPLHQVDVASNWIAGEDQRIRIAAGATVAVTLPNSVAVHWQYSPNDYGFSAGATLPLPPQGSTGAADNIAWRAPRAGSRVEIVGTTQGLWFYRDDLNTWQSAIGLAIDSELPLSPRLDFAALLAERLADIVTDAPQPTPMLLKRIARARAALLTQPGHAHTRRVGEYF
jgi:hypothetical protein